MCRRPNDNSHGGMRRQLSRSLSLLWALGDPTVLDWMAKGVAVLWLNSREERIRGTWPRPYPPFLCSVEFITGRDERDHVVPPVIETVHQHA